MNPVYLHHFCEIKPPNRMSQDVLLQWLIHVHIEAEKLKTQINDDAVYITLKKLFDRYAVKDKQISQRYFECEDMFSSDRKMAEVYRIDEQNPNGVDIEKRTQFFAKKALGVLQKMYPKDQKQNLPEHLIHVTCTGYISPSAPQRIVTEDFWTKDTGITHAYHMGCYAALPAIRIAEGLVRGKVDFTADVVHTEMCGLHMNPLAQTPEQMVVQTLFADGHMKYSVSSQNSEKGRSFKLLTIKEKIVKDSHQDMSWIPTPWGMQMNLSRDVPQKIKNELKSFFNEMIAECDFSLSDVSQATFAIHPGGPKIIDAVQEVFVLSELQVAESKKILFERGNMSSATLPHVWNEILQKELVVGTKVISFAFGPGLTIFGSVFEVC
jgi:predicted naringenin-chalcone synthase